MRLPQRPDAPTAADKKPLALRRLFPDNAGAPHRKERQVCAARTAERSVGTLTKWPERPDCVRTGTLNRRSTKVIGRPAIQAGREKRTGKAGLVQGGNENGSHSWRRHLGGHLYRLVRQELS